MFILHTESILTKEQRRLGEEFIGKKLQFADNYRLSNFGLDHSFLAILGHGISGVFHAEAEQHP